jgi:hypothetical protein
VCRATRRRANKRLPKRSESIRRASAALRRTAGLERDRRADPRGRQPLDRSHCDEAALDHGRPVKGDARRRRPARPGRRQGACQAAETCREHDCGCGCAELEDTHCRAAAARLCDCGDRPLGRCRTELSSQRCQLTLDVRAGDATPTVRAQRRFFELGQLPVEAKRRLQTGTFTLEAQDGSHTDYDARRPQELERLTVQPAGASAPLPGERVGAATRRARPHRRRSRGSPA